VDDLGSPIAYLALDEGVPVYDRDGERIGIVEHVVADGSADIFDGVVVRVRPAPGHHRFADAEQIAALHERGVVLSVGADALHHLRHDVAGGEGPLEARLRRAWDRLSGRA
jgi:uncharacterized protein YrrD